MTTSFARLSCSTTTSKSFCGVYSWAVNSTRAEWAVIWSRVLWVSDATRFSGTAEFTLTVSDTLVINDDGSLYDPELMSEVAQAVAREGLKVSQVFAMHQGPTEWKAVLALVDRAQRSS